MRKRPHYLPFISPCIIMQLIGWALALPMSLSSQNHTEPGPDFGQYRLAQDFHFRRLGVEQGLSSPVVTCVLQDRLGFIWAGTADGLNRFDGYGFKVYKNDQDDSLSLSNNRVTALLEDSKGFLWVGTAKGLNRFDPKTDQFTPFFADTLHSGNLRDDHIRSLHQDGMGLIWVGTNRGGLHVFDAGNRVFRNFIKDPKDPTSLGDNSVQTICEDRRGHLWLGTMGGLCRLDRRSGKFRTWSEDIENPEALSQNWVNAVLEDPEGNIWAGATHGLNRLDPETGLFQRYWPESKPFWLGANGHRILSFYLDRSKNIWIGTQWGGLYRYDYCADQFYKATFNISNPQSLSDNVVTCILQDREGSLWVGTESGLNQLEPQPRPFRTFTHNPADTNSLADVKVLSFLEESPDLLWVGTQRGGLLSTSMSFDRFTQHPLGYKGWYPMIHALAADSLGNHWIGTMGSGFAQLDRATGKFRYWNFQPSNRNWISVLHRDRKGGLWYGSMGGINLFHPDTQESEYYPFAPEDPLSRMTSSVTAILDDSNNRLWVGTSSNGLKLFDRDTRQYSHFPFRVSDGRGTNSPFISFVLEDRNKRIWVGTFDKGFYEFFPEKNLFRRFSTKNGLPTDALEGMVEDSRGYLWIATGKGLSRFDPSALGFRNFTQEDGLPTNSLTSIYRGPWSGQIYLGTLGKGFCVFHPDNLADNKFVPPVVISSLQRFRRQGESMVVLEEKGISARKRINLSYRDNIITFQVAALSYRKTGKNQYAYRLDGFNDHWIPLGNKREITFTGLAPGRYTLRVKGSNGEGLWNEEGTTLKIRIVPPWYASLPAFILYFVAGILAVRWLNRFQLSRKMASAEAARLKELDQIKTRLFTNITHEFRTPLNIIGGMAGQIREDPDRWMGEGLEMIERNTGQLIHLVTQMLDLSKLEAGSLPLKMLQGDVVVYLKYLFESFHSLAEAKGIDLVFESPLNGLLMDYDPEKMRQIVSNLLSNAIKFTPAGGRVWMEVGLEEGERPSLLLQVGDTGPGIPEEKLPYIFDRFFQVDDQSTRAAEGTGIGLALTRELVRLLQGQIEVESAVDRGSVFSVTLPVERKAPLVSGQPQTPEEEMPPFVFDESLPLVLIVEDNPDVVTYLSSCLEGQYRIQVAYDGRQGIEKGFDLIPDVVISDVMMPEKDGFEVCRALKTDVRTSHIPVILLTARADMDSRLQGLEHGADVYLPKPFHKAELLLQLRKLYELRKNLRAIYLSLAAGAPAQFPESIPEEENEFVLRVRESVEAHLADPAYSVERLSRDLAMGYSSLHRKLTALTGYSANHFIRYIRLREAQRLLKDSDLTVSEIAFRTGFEDPGYFGRAFKKEFGVTPKEWRG